ncbi:MAG: KR domain-containing protein, partial [Bacteroidota bacterium]
RRVLDLARSRFGDIHGVVHSAGVLGDGAIRQKSPDDLERVLAAKVAGTAVLNALFADVSLDFLVLFSSLSAIKPGFGQIAYSAANNFLDAFVHSAAARRHRFCACINWDVWQGEGMAYNAVTPQVLRSLKEEDFRRRGILPEEGIEVFARVLGNALSHVLISTSDYLELLESNGRDLAYLYLQSLNGQERSAPRHTRPELDTPYEEPRGEVERTLAGIWRDLLGIGGLGSLDDFFALGGDSLIGTQMISRIRLSLGLQLPTKIIYLHPTIRSLSEAIEGELLARADPERIGALLDQLERPG